MQFWQDFAGGLQWSHLTVITATVKSATKMETVNWATGKKERQKWKLLKMTMLLFLPVA